MREEAQLVLMRYGLERLLYRLSQSKHADDFVVKGAMLYLVWKGEPYRPTKDLDLLALKSNAPAEMKKTFQELCRLAVVDDALVFMPESVKATQIQEDNAYHAVRVTLEARLGKARIPMQVDIGFGDAVTPKTKKAEFPKLLDFPAPQISMYPMETVIAEKFETMVKLGLLNSRTRDYYDLWALSREFEFEGETLCKAIRATFRRRKTALPAEAPFALSPEFAEDDGKLKQWQAFLRKGRLRLQEKDFGKVISAIRDFLMPVVAAAHENRVFDAFWSKSGPWK